jgi:hypothetical protein
MLESARRQAEETIPGCQDPRPVQTEGTVGGVQALFLGYTKTTAGIEAQSNVGESTVDRDDRLDRCMSGRRHLKSSSHWTQNCDLHVDLADRVVMDPMFSSLSRAPDASP